MSKWNFKPRKAPGVAHLYHERLVAFQHTPHVGTGQDTSPNIALPPNILFHIGGLGDNILTVPYVQLLAQRVPKEWCVVEIMLSSSGTGWATGSLHRDAREIGECVEYFQDLQRKGHARSGEGKWVLMGHSTGCQDVMQYLVGNAQKSADSAAYDGPDEHPHVHGAILQAPVSDREAVAFFARSPAHLAEGIACAHALLDADKGDACLPLELTVEHFDGVPVSALRFLSLVEEGGGDDFFSSDLSVETLRGTFGRVPRGTRLCVLCSGDDMYVPKSVDKEALVRKWIGIVKEGKGEVDETRSGVVRGASHNLKGDEELVVEDFLERVIGFLGDL